EAVPLVADINPCGAVGRCGGWTPIRPGETHGVISIPVRRVAPHQGVVADLMGDTGFLIEVRGPIQPPMGPVDRALAGQVDCTGGPETRAVAFWVCSESKSCVAMDRSWSRALLCRKMGVVSITRPWPTALEVINASEPLFVAKTVAATGVTCWY